MVKNKNSQFGYSVKKIALTVCHLLALTIFVAGVSVIYCNSNFKKGISSLNSEKYEDSPAFASLFETDTQSVFDYIRYRDVFESNGKVDLDKEMFSFDSSPGSENVYSLDEVMAYAKKRGYYLDNNYRVVADPTVKREAETAGQNEPGPGGTTTEIKSNQSYPINWRSYSSNASITEPGDAYMTLDALVAETLTCYGKYSAAVRKFNSGTGNFFYKVVYDSDTYTNLKDLTASLAKEYGKYAICTSDNVLPDNNLSATPTTLANLASEYNPDKDNEGGFTAIIAVDTDYPQQDDFYFGKIRYGKERDHYFYGLVLMIAGALSMLVTFLFMLPMSGHIYRKSPEIRLNRLDRAPLESNAALCAASVIICQFLADRVVKRLLHMMVSQTNWVFAERMMTYVIVYLCTFIMFFTLVRGYKAHVLYRNSFFRKFQVSVSEFFHGMTYSRRLTVYFFAFLAGNAILLSLISRLLLTRHTLTSRFLVLGLFVLFCLLNGFYFRKQYRKAAETDEISGAIKNIAAGDTNYQLDLSDFEGKEADMANSVNHIGQGLQTALNDRVRSERMKADLITNVSHDIKTPLTSIINYVDLIKKENPADEKIREYLNVLDQKSQHLKTLTEDLVEASKASTGNITMDAADIDFVELVEQTNGEFEERFVKRNLDLVAALPQESILIHADGQHLWRVLENLYTNAFKYAAESSRVYAGIEKKAGNVIFTLKNVSAHELNISADELTERFVRGDRSRNTEGSGLGLSIAKSLTELQGGTFRIEIDGDLFKASVSFPVMLKEAKKEEAAPQKTDTAGP